MWDGRDYCRSCVEQTCSGLADSAVGHPILVERLPSQRARFVGRAFLATAAVILGFLVLFFVSEGLGSGQTTLWIVCFGATVFPMLLTLLYLMNRVDRVVCLRELHVQCGTLTLKYADTAGRASRA